ncbi:ABC transporter ATP-binding protein [Sodalis sp. dw_96]|uniref:ABC transporter ATP-binding protein n=1 Tax=Sodalis sp. dw_96 TaxID=2719794 RepID=UPI0021062F62|nr:ABC transporter ATP-binding protein [Sodalis sp. dw_96]
MSQNLPAAASPVVAVNGLTKRFPGIVANDHIDLALWAGEVHVLLGENGAGKSTLVAMLAGLQQPDEGHIAVNGREEVLHSPRRALALGIGTVFQHAMMVPGLSVVDNIALGDPWWRRPARRFYAERVGQIARDIGVRVNPFALAGSLSLGEQQQAEIVRSLLRGSRVLILDEATAMLTPNNADELGQLMRRLVSQGLALVFITHKLNEALAWGDRITVLRRGRKVGEIPPLRLKTLAKEQATREVMQLMFNLSAEDGDDTPSIIESGAILDGSSASEMLAMAETPPAGGHNEILHDIPANKTPTVSSRPAVTGNAAKPDDVPSAKYIDAKGAFSGYAAAGPVLEVKALAVNDALVPLRGIDLEVAAGEIVGIAGIDGNGQKQLAEALAGQRPVAGGRILLAGEAIEQLSIGQRRKRGLRYVTDDRLGEGTVGSFPVSINLLLKQIGEAPFWRRGIEHPEAIARHARERIAEYDIRTPEVDTPIGKLSGGNIQKALLARELGGPARMVIFAKPTHGLDVRNMTAVRERIRRSARAGMAVILISTDMEELLGLADRIGVMSGGRIVGMVAKGPRARSQIGELMSGVTL